MDTCLVVLWILLMGATQKNNCFFLLAAIHGNDWVSLMYNEK